MSNDALWKIIGEQIYRQYRVNQARGLTDQVDILATKNHADRFHKLLERKYATSHAMPAVVKWSESPVKVLGMTCRTYTGDQVMFPRCTVNVLIPDCRRYTNIFAVPDYQGGDYFCFLKMKRRKFPQVKVPRVVK